uniref:Uncharacterized protein n=1 Tax=Rhizophora mucronata TaxID=61149 RepID=A0A2P2IVA4_RHIMU
MPPLPSRPIFFKIPTIPAAASRAALRVTTSHTLTTSFRNFKGTSGISRVSLKILATSLRSGEPSSCISAIKSVSKLKRFDNLDGTGPKISAS